MTTALPQARPGGEISDEEIVQRVLAGETELYELLLRRYNQRVYRSVRAILRNADDAEDVMQQAWVNAYRHLADFEGRSSFTTWLTTIAIREAWARNRKNAPYLTAVTDDEGEDAMTQFQTPDADPERQTVASDIMRLVEAEIAALPETYRSVIILREVEGLTTEETAESLEVSVDVVKTRLHRARTMLRDALMDRAGGGFQTLFTFAGHDCDKMVAGVMSEIRKM